MANVTKDFAKGKPIFVGLDVHKKDWTVHVYSAVTVNEPYFCTATVQCRT